MENNEILEGNKLIAEFMGLKKQGFGANEHFTDNGNRIVATSNGLQYHTSWDWIMPVVEKIIKMPIENGCKKSILPINLYLESEFLFETKELTKTLDGYKYGFYYNSKFDKNYISGNLKHNAFLAVVEFIKWYNQNKKNE